jgi:predicted phosphodiesterase
MKPKVAPNVVLAVIREHPSMSNKDVGKKLGISEASVRRALDAVEFTRPRLADPGITIEKPVRLSVADPVAITADYHFPLTRYDLVERMLDSSAREGVKTLAIAGDLFHADTPSSFDYKQDSADMTTEKKTASEFIDAAAEVYDNIIFSWGNHDARYQKRLSYGVDYVTTMKMMLESTKPSTKEKMIWTNLDHFYLDTGPASEQLWYVCHPKSYSQVPLTQSRRIASKEICNVITAHSHHHAVGHDISGRFTCGEIGGFFDRTITEYLQRSTSFPTWQNGYGLLYPDNVFEMRSEAWISR